VEENKWMLYTNIYNKGYRPTTAIDAGCASGEWTRSFRSVFPATQIIGIEANMNITENCPANIIEHGVLWSEDNVPMKFYANDSPSGWNSGDSVYREHTDYYSDDRVRPIDVYTTTINTICKKHNVQKINVLKLDLQGAELDALCGASEIFDAVDFVEIECATASYNIGSPTIYDVFEFMKPHFDVYELLDVHRWRSNNRLFHVDVLFKNKNLSLAGDDICGT